MKKPILVIDKDDRRLGFAAAKLRMLRRPVVAAINLESALAFCTACKPFAVIVGERAVSPDCAEIEKRYDETFGDDDRTFVKSFGY